MALLVELETTTLLFCKTRRQERHFTQQSSVLLAAIGKSCDMLFRHNQKMDGRRRIDVVEGDQVVVFIDRRGWDLLGRDFAKNTIFQIISRYQQPNGNRML